MPSKLSAIARPSDAAVRKALEARGSNVKGLQQEIEKMRRERDAAQARYEQYKAQYERLVTQEDSTQEDSAERVCRPWPICVRCSWTARERSHSVWRAPWVICRPHPRTCIHS